MRNMQVREESQQDKYSRNRSRIGVIVAVIFALFCVAIIVGVVAFNIYKIGKVPIHVVYAPFAAKVKVGDHKLRNNATNYIEPGKYTLTVEFENFESVTKEIEITEETKRILGTLKPSNEAGQKYMQAHEKEYQAVEALYGVEANEFGKAQRDKWPIIGKLPIKDPHYTIGYSIPDLDHLTINIYSSVAYRGLAINKLKTILTEEDYGIYDVEVKDLVNPYTKPEINNEVDPRAYIRKAFPNYSFDIGAGEYKDSYYYTFLRGQREGVAEIFHVVLIKGGSSWRFAGNPYPVLTSANTPDVPLDIIFKANQQ